MDIRRLILRSLFAFIAFCVGWAIYMLAVALTSYDGLITMVFAPIIAGIFNLIAVGLVLLIGLLLRIPVLQRWWTSSRWWAISLISLSLNILVLGYWLGLRATVTNPASGQQFETLHPVAAVVCYFVLLFAIANWPLRRRGGHYSHGNDHTTVSPPTNTTVGQIS